ncbi:MAG TPA: NUDIX domain-containing protein [Candidatus Saccharimonadales bacterium]|jgi:8-oxo-dGTP pyrophosphatase MutT (NUDIX family)
MSLYNHALYQVATKALIYKGEKILVLITPDGYVDFPGGRVDESERDIPWTEALKREIAEELGENIVIDIGDTVFVSKRQYKIDTLQHIAAIFFRCTYVSGEVTLSEEHSDHVWLTAKELIDSKRKFLSEDERKQLSTLFSTI